MDPIVDPILPIYPEPTTLEPFLRELEDWIFDGEAEATDGCPVDIYGKCRHGHLSWLVHLGLLHLDPSFGRIA